jgi:hypothetical protein
MVVSKNHPVAKDAGIRGIGTICEAVKQQTLFNGCISNFRNQSISYYFMDCTLMQGQMPPWVGMTSDRTTAEQ